MVKNKIKPSTFERVVVYNNHQWQILKEKREVAIKILQIIDKLPSKFYIYGSVARGDVRDGSDIDLVVLDVVSSFQLLYLLQDTRILSKFIIMATPNHSIKGVIELENDITISFPLSPFSNREIDFYKFGGMVEVKDIETEIRVSGIDKRLVLINPTNDGHKERSVMQVSSKELTRLGFSPRIIEERMRALNRRDKIGRTGVFLKEEVLTEIGFENHLKQLEDRNHLIRKKIRHST